MKSKQLTVGYIEPVGGHGGMNYYNFSLAKELEKIGTHVVIYTCDATSPPSKAEGYACILSFRGVFGHAPKVARLARYVKGLLSSLRHARLSNADVLHFHLFQMGGLELLTFTLARMHGFPIVATVHDVEGFAGRSSNLMSTAILSLASELIVHNKASLTELKAKTGSDRRINVVNHGNYLEQVNSNHSSLCLYEKHKIPKSNKVILFFGQIKRVKGLDILLNSLPEIVIHHPNTTLLIAGKVWKDDLAYYKDIVATHKVERNVIFDIGYIKDELVSAYYAIADAVVLPYRKIYQSGVLLMAMSYGKTVVASNLPAMRETVTHNSDGLLFESECPSDLAKKINSILAKEVDTDAISRRATERMLKAYSWDGAATLTNKVYNLAINKQKSR